MSIARDLYQLQEVDTALRLTFKRRKRCPRKSGKSACRQSQNQTGRGTEKSGNPLRAAEIHRVGIDDLTNKIKETEKKLYSGKISIPKN